MVKMSEELQKETDEYVRRYVRKPKQKPVSGNGSGEALASEPLLAAEGRQLSAQQIFNEGREALRRDINDHGIYRVPEGSRELWPMKDDPFYGSDPSFYIWQFYLRRLMLEPKHLIFIARCFWSVYRTRYDKLPFQIAGVEQASIPILTAILLTAQSVGVPLHAFTVRKERKKFGLKNIIEGEARADLPVVFVDDLTSGGHATLWHFVRTMKEARLQIFPRCFVVVYKGKRNDLKDIPTTQGNLGIDSIFTLDDFDMTFEQYDAHKKRLGMK